ncbi:unnamed protein product [Chrysodeixis includens]|uniref:Uncharacterized protein n=1 Tax=Chrysodeixis includens TaxID=689277 RepID=A0A9N8Q1Y3_CHRIL|nr:unnamed protein product [Chrysodeixis includens]
MLLRVSVTCGALKAPAALLRLRVYQACGALGGGAVPPPAPLLRLLAAELAGSADPSGANVATGEWLLRCVETLRVSAVPPLLAS